MNAHYRFLLLAALALTLTMARFAPAQDDIADIPSEDLRAGKDENKRFFLIGPSEESAVPKQGFGLVVVMPGGDGSADFLPFVKRIYKHAAPEGFLFAQPVAVKWAEDQEIVWPTGKNRVAGMKFTTEEFVEAVIEDVGGKHKIDPHRVLTLSWSSSGPAAYAISLTSKKVTGSFVAMTVYKPDLLPKLDRAKGHAYYIYHSPEDRVCPPRMADQAAAELKKAGGNVKRTNYQGGHGWRGNIFGDIKTGLQWL